MAIINCPECGKEISDQSKHCVYCGFPLVPKNDVNDCISNYELYHLVVDHTNSSKVTVIKILKEITGLDLVEAKKIIDEQDPLVIDNLTYEKAVEYREMFSKENIKATIKNNQGNEVDLGKVCPNCKTKNRLADETCPNCGYVWNKKSLDNNSNQNSGTSFWGIVGAIIVAVLILAIF